MSSATTTVSSEAQSPRWRTIFDHAYSHSLTFEPGDAVPHGRLVSSLRAEVGIHSNSTAATVIRNGVANGCLRQTEGKYAPRYRIERDHPSTGDLRQAFPSVVKGAMRNRENIVAESPTSSGKTYAPSTTRWRDYMDVTGGEPVVIFHVTKNARDDAFAESEDSYVAPHRLLGRKDACPLARGDYDSGNDKGNTPITAPDGSEPSEWFDKMCKERGVPLSVAHGLFEEDSNIEPPCCADGEECLASSQWDGIPRDDEGVVRHDVIHATHGFTNVPQLIENCNVIIDEEPDFDVDISKGWVKDAITSYLQETGFPEESWEDLVMIVTGKAEKDRDNLPDSPDDADPSWFKHGEDAHALAPGIVQAILNAEKRSHGRWVGETRFSYPDLISGRDEPDHEAVLRIVFDRHKKIRKLQVVPDFSQARCVIGLDAHPTEPRWRAKTLPDIETVQLVDGEDLHEWRRKERDLKIIQVGDNKNSWTRWNFNEDKVMILCEALRQKYGKEFQSGITAMRQEDKLEQALEEAGVDEPDTIYFGMEKSVNTFDDYTVGLLAGCISPRDDQIKDWLALLDKDATPKRDVVDDYQGQEYVGPDADVAEELVAAVREKRVLQACGRYARSPAEPDDGATVYVLTNVLPDEYVDEEIEDVQVFGKKHQKILNYVGESPNGATAREIHDEGIATRQYAYELFRKCANCSWLHETKDTDRKYNPTVYRADLCPKGFVEV